MPAVSSSSSRVVCSARSSPSQSGTKVPARMSFEEPSSASGRPCTSSTSQSAQRVNPCRYSALHCGQNMIQRSLLHLEFHLGAPIGRTRCCLSFFLDLLFPIHYHNGQVNVRVECGGLRRLLPKPWCCSSFLRCLSRLLPSTGNASFRINNLRNANFVSPLF